MVGKVLVTNFTIGRGNHRVKIVCRSPSGAASFQMMPITGTAKMVFFGGYKNLSVELEFTRSTYSATIDFTQILEG